jgi:SulP family sulfate permease
MIAIFEARNAGLLGFPQWGKNLVAGLIVGIVALPLAMAFAIASGAKPEQGIYTAIVAGAITSLFGGSRVQISGPTGAFIVILSGITAKYGIAGLQVATLMAGVMLVAMGLARMGSVIKFIPDPVIVGFTSGIAVIIWVGQWKDFMGLAVEGSGEHFHEKLLHLITAFPQAHLATTVLACATLAILLISPRLLRRIPAPLVAMLVATFAQYYFEFDGVATIGSAFGGIPQSLPTFSILDISFRDVVRLVGPAFTIALLGAVESLLSAVVADGMAGTRHDSNQELIGQGLANIAAPMFGGFAATGAIARTATSVRNGANSPIAGLFHSVTLVLIILLLAPYARHIPLCALSAILFVVAWNMSEAYHFVHMLRTAPRADAFLLMITFLLTVFADLVVAVNVGVVLAALLFMRRMAHAVEIQEDSGTLPISEMPACGLPQGTLAYSIDGPFFFGAAEKLENTLTRIQQHANTIVLRLGRVPFIDATGINTLREIVAQCRRQNTRVVLCEMRPAVQSKLARAGILDALGDNNVFVDIRDFVVSIGLDPDAPPPKSETIRH